MSVAALSAVRDWGRRVALPAYLVAVIVGGAGCVVWLALGHPILPERQHWPLLGLLAVFLVLGEMYPLTISRAPVDQVYTFSGTPALALVCLGPLWLAVAAQLVALLLQSLKAGSPLLKLGFNLAQYTITIVATRLAYCLVTGKPVLGGHQVFTSSNVAAALLAACVFLVVNVLLVSTVISLSEGESLRRGLVGYARAELPLSITLLAVAPLVLASLEFNLLTFPLCLLPVLAVRRSAASAAERELAAMHDSLTGLPNRGVLLLEGERLMRRSDVKAGVGLLLVDLDHFKEINDTLGHHAGDQLLRLVSSRLRDAVRPEDVLARLGGDEFAVLCPGVATPEAALSLGQRVIEALGQPFEVAEVTLHVEASVGVALAPLHAEDVESLLQRADVALYQAKSLGRGVAHVYDATNDHYSVERLALMESLRRTLDTNLRVHYQPKVRPDGSIAGVEALVRWEHPEQGLLLPGEFLPAAENSGLLIPLTLHVLDEALRQVASWRR
ncbi:MAG: putative bifunctional diguanylate cyclase/phosphodiesterase, partial [Actinomycetes bacterium]